MMRKIQTLQDFYALMFMTKETKAEITRKHLKGERISAQLTNPLRDAIEELTSLKIDPDGTYNIALSKDKTIKLDLTYEITELKKDIFFLSHSEDEFYSYLETLHKNFLDEINEGENILRGINFKNFITDRDGTVNNYCGRYISSIQSVYNAVFLTRFAQKIADNSIILTSAPLDNVGLIDISVAPKNIFIYAGSKGREYFDKNNSRKTFPVEKEKQDKLDKLNKKLKKLVTQKKYSMFSLIGSGLQFKFGQTTIARQDITGSIPKKESDDFLKLIIKIVSEIDPKNKYFRIEDTGKDIEIILTVENKTNPHGPKDFDKGDGLDFLDKDLDLQISSSPCLICGDTSSDVPMVKTAMNLSSDTYAVFVTENEDLKIKVKNTCPNSFFVSTPDILVAILNNIGMRKTTV